METFKSPSQNEHERADDDQHMGPNVIVMSDAGKLLFNRFGWEEHEELTATLCGLIQAVSLNKRTSVSWLFVHYKLIFLSLMRSFIFVIGNNNGLFSFPRFEFQP